MEPILRFDNVSKHYPNGVHALKGVSFQVCEGEFISVIGPSGSGKSTLLRAINRLIPISGGTVWLDGQTVTGDGWIETAREWAMSSGVSLGENANGAVAREQLVTMLWRYAGEPEGTAPLSAWSDAASVSDWAAEAMSWAIDNGVITGMSADTLAPQGSATRAQCAAILMRCADILA